MSEEFSVRQTELYLKRIGLHCAPDVNSRGLQELHRAQYFSIPFENFDIRLGLGINLDKDHVFEKLVVRRRGGYCFELNGMLLRALRTLGFQARPLLARVHLSAEPSGKTHQLNLVEIGAERWLVDAGFGAGGPRIPFPLRVGEHSGGGGQYYLSQVEPWGWLLQTLENGQWKDSYSFTLGHVTDADIELGNHYTATSPRTHFTQVCVAGLPTPSGRVSVRDAELTEIVDDDKSTRTLTREEYLDTLDRLFGIQLPSFPPVDFRPVA